MFYSFGQKPGIPLTMDDYQERLEEIDRENDMKQKTRPRGKGFEKLKVDSNTIINDELEPATKDSSFIGDMKNEKPGEISGPFNAVTSVTFLFSIDKFAYINCFL